MNVGDASSGYNMSIEVLDRGEEFVRPQLVIHISHGKLNGKKDHVEETS